MAEGVAAEGPAQSDGDPTVIRYGIHKQEGDYSGNSVSDIRTNVADVWRLPKDAVAYVNKEPVGDDYTMQPGDKLQFHRKAGEKG